MCKTVFLNKDCILSYLKWENRWTILVCKVPIGQIIWFSNIALKAKTKRLILKQLHYQLLSLKDASMLERAFSPRIFPCIFSDGLINCFFLLDSHRTAKLLPLASAETSYQQTSGTSTNSQLIWKFSSLSSVNFYRIK